MTRKGRSKLSTESLLKMIRHTVETGNYLDTRHANDRRTERLISRLEMEYVLLHGRHEKRKDQYEEIHQSWNYAIRGKTIDKRDLRVIVSFENKMLVITAMEVGK